MRKNHFSFKIRKTNRSKLLFENCVIIRHWTFRHLENKICQTSRILSPSLHPLRAHPFRSERDVWERGRGYSFTGKCLRLKLVLPSACFANGHDADCGAAAVTALALHQRWPESRPGPSVISALRFRVVCSRPCPEEIFSGFSSFPLSTKIDIAEFLLDEGLSQS